MGELQKFWTLGLAALLVALLVAIGFRGDGSGDGSVTGDGSEETDETEAVGGDSSDVVGGESEVAATPAGRNGPIGPSDFDCATSGSGVEIVFVYSEEKESVMNRVVSGFNELECGEVQGFRLASGLQMSRLAANWPEENDGIPPPHLASPSTSLWVPEANATAAANGNGVIVEDDGDVASLGWAPLVVAMPQSVADELAPDRTISLQELADRVGTEVAGHPFVLRKTNPEVASTGLMALVAAYAASPDFATLDGDSLAADEATRALARGLEAATPAYGRTSLTVLKEMCELDNRGVSPAAAVSALLTEEQLVVDYNRGTGDVGCENGGELNEQLVAVYLESPTPVSEHPLLHIDADHWVDAEQRQVAEAFVDYATHPETLAVVSAELGIRDANGGSPLDDPGSFGIDDQLPASWLTERPRPTAEAIEAIRAEWHELRSPFHVHLLVDLSGSMGDPAGIEGRESTRLDEVKVAMTEFVAGLQGPDDAVAISTFPAPQAELAVQDELDLTVVDGEGLQRIQGVIDGLVPEGGTPLYDAIDTTYRSLHREAAGSEAITVLVVLTDGLNEPGRPREEWTPEEIEEDAILGADTAAALGRLAAEADPTERVRIFTIGYGPEAAADDAVLQLFAVQTFGEATQSQTSEITMILRSIISSI